MFDCDVPLSLCFLTMKAVLMGPGIKGSSSELSLYLVIVVWYTCGIVELLGPLFRPLPLPSPLCDSFLRDY